MENILIRIFGIAGFVLGVLAFQSNKHKGIVMAKLGSEVAFTVQYFLLDAYTGSIMNFVGVIRNYVFYRLVEKKQINKSCNVYFLRSLYCCGADNLGRSRIVAASCGQTDFNSCIQYEKYKNNQNSQSSYAYNVDCI